MDWASSLPWSRLGELPAGAQIALGGLIFAAALGWVAAIDAFLTPDPKTPKRKRRFGPRALALLVLAILPGGLVGTAAVVLIMGRKDWRRDAIHIVGVSLIPGGLLAWFCSPSSPVERLAFAPRISDAILEALGILFACLHVWALVKLLREAWGEPEDKVPWWPPLALVLQTLLLVASSWAILG